MNLKVVIVFIGSFLILGNAKVKGQDNSPETDEEKIVSVINNYIVGTAYSYPDSLKLAFMPTAQMFLDKAGEPLYVLTIEQYAKGVGKSEAGKFTGRVTNILSVDRFQGIATAKLEVFIPGVNKRFIDMLLLKKLYNGWKIICKTAASEPYNN